MIVTDYRARENNSIIESRARVTTSKPCFQYSCMNNEVSTKDSLVILNVENLSNRRNARRKVYSSGEGGEEEWR